MKVPPVGKELNGDRMAGPLIHCPHFCSVSPQWNAHLSAPSYEGTGYHGLRSLCEADHAPVVPRALTERLTAELLERRLIPFFPIPPPPVASSAEYIIPSGKSDMRPPDGSVNDPPSFPTPRPSLHNDERNSRSRGTVTVARRAPPVLFFFFLCSSHSSRDGRTVSTPKYPRTHTHPHPFAKRTIRDRRPAD